MRTQFQHYIAHYIALILLVVCGALTVNAQEPIVKFGTLEGRIDIPLNTTKASNPTITCANLRVVVWPLNSNAMREAQPQASGVASCSYKLPGVVVGQAHGIKLRWAGGGDYEVRFDNGQSQARFAIAHPNQTFPFNFRKLELFAVPQ